MAAEERKRPPRTPLSPEEVAQIVSLKKMRNAKKLATFKRSGLYKYCNIFNIICFFIYWELLLCFMGPCHYQTHYSKGMRIKRGDAINVAGRRIITKATVSGVNDEKYVFAVND